MVCRCKERGIVEGNRIGIGRAYRLELAWDAVLDALFTPTA